MGRRWMYGKRDFDFRRRLEEFISRAVEHQTIHGGDPIICPCGVCQNRKKEHDGPLSEDELGLLGEQCQIMERMLCSTLLRNPTHLFSIEINESVYIYKNPITLYLTKGDIRQMFRYKWLNISMLQLWGSFLHEYGTSLGVSKVVGYLCPERLSSYVHDPVEMKKYVSHVLKIQENKKYVMGAFFELDHWMLVVFCPKDDIAYIFDSDQKTKKTLAIKDHLAVIWKLFYVLCGRRLPSKKNILEVKLINCPQQPHDFECGYYVMKWMYDITAYYSMIEDNLEKSVSGLTMMVEDMDQVRKLLAKYCMEHL